MSDLTIEGEFEAQLARAYARAFGSAASPKWLTAMGLRAGTSGTVETLDAVGQKIGVTRERVRQVMSRIAPHLKGVELGHASDIVTRLQAASPVAEPVGALLATFGLARPTLTGPALLNLLQLVGISPGDLISVDGWLVTAADQPVLDAIKVARKHTSKFGLTTAEEIRQVLATPEDPFDAAAIERILRADPTVNWAGAWLWVAKDDNSHANRIVNTARSILSVNSPQSVRSIHTGVERQWRYRELDILCPIDALRHFFESSPYFIVEDDMVRPTEELDYRDFLGETAASMVDVIKSSPHQVMDRQSLYEACDEAGIPSGTYTVWTTYAPWMDQFGRNVWGLRGSSPNPAAVEVIRKAAESRSRAEPRRTNWSWAPDGKMMLTRDITTSFRTTCVLILSPEVHKLIAGGSLAIMADGLEIGTVKTGPAHTFCWGWHPILTHLGARQGDVLQLAIDVASKTATVRLGGQELWDD